MSDAAAPKLKNISSWKLNKAEEEQLKTRVANGEEELTVKRALQKLKAEAALSRKTARLLRNLLGKVKGAQRPKQRPLCLPRETLCQMLN